MNEQAWCGGDMELLDRPNEKQMNRMNIGNQNWCELIFSNY